MQDKKEDLEKAVFAYNQFRKWIVEIATEFGFKLEYRERTYSDGQEYERTENELPIALHNGNKRFNLEDHPKTPLFLHGSSETIEEVLYGDQMLRFLADMIRELEASKLQVVETKPEQQVYEQPREAA
jgi:hypothetical protein